MRDRIVGGAALLALALASSHAWAFRSGEDTAALAGRGRVRLERSQLVVRLSRANLPDAITEPDAEQALQSALASWNAPACSSFSGSFGGWQDGSPQSGDGANTIGWVDDWAERGLPASAPGNTGLAYRSTGGAWSIDEADVLLNVDQDWASLPLEDVLTHELGHALGLLHPCEDDGADNAPLCSNAAAETRASTMYPFYELERDSLAPDDIAGLCYLYPIEGGCAGGCGLHEACVDDECRATCDSNVCASGEACGAWGCAPAESCLLRDCSGQPCRTRADCGPLLACRAGACRAGSGRWGDTCRDNWDCADGGCVEHVCQPACESNEECGPTGVCSPTDDARATACVESRAYGIGLTCNVGEDCSTGICLLSDGRRVCTTSCEADLTCPTDWSCKTVEERDVCTPPPQSSGCSVIPRPSKPSSGLIIALAASVATLSRHRKRRKISQ